MCVSSCVRVFYPEGVCRPTAGQMRSSRAAMRLDEGDGSEDGHEQSET